VPPVQRGVLCPRSKSGGQVVKINVLAKEDLVEDVRAVFRDYTAEQMKRSSAITLVEIVVVDHDGNEHPLDPIAEVK
jgi:hypothetical protein